MHLVAHKIFIFSSLTHLMDITWVISYSATVFRSMTLPGFVGMVLLSVVY